LKLTQREATKLNRMRANEFRSNKRCARKPNGGESLGGNDSLTQETPLVALDGGSRVPSTNGLMAVLGTTLALRQQKGGRKMEVGTTTQTLGVASLCWGAYGVDEDRFLGCHKFLVRLASLVIGDEE